MSDTGKQKEARLPPNMPQIPGPFGPTPTGELQAAGQMHHTKLPLGMPSIPVNMPAIPNQFRQEKSDANGEDKKMMVREHVSDSQVVLGGDNKLTVSLNAVKNEHVMGKMTDCADLNLKHHIKQPNLPSNGRQEVDAHRIVTDFNNVAAEQEKQPESADNQKVIKNVVENEIPRADGTESLPSPDGSYVKALLSVSSRDSKKKRRKHSRSRSRSHEKKYDKHDKHRNSKRDVRRDDRDYSREKGYDRRDRRKDSRERSRRNRSNEKRRYNRRSSSSQASQSSSERKNYRHRRESPVRYNGTRTNDDQYFSSRHTHRDERETERERRTRRNRKADVHDSMASHPYFQPKKEVKEVKKTGANVDDEGNELFWDGFQWVPRQRQKAYFNPWQEHMIEKIVKVSGSGKAENLERVANSRTVIVDNLSLDLGSTSKELQKWFLEQLRMKGIANVQIVDIDVKSGGADNSVQIELEHQDMIDHFKKLDGIQCLGEAIKVRRVGEETTQTNAQAAVIALTALQEITGKKPVGKLEVILPNGEAAEEPEEPDEAVGPQNALGQNSTSLKTLNPSKTVKISNVFERDLELTDEIREELRQDFVEEMNSVTKFRNLTVINKELSKLGAEVGSIFVEFANIKNAVAGIKKVKGRIYDGHEIKTAFISDTLYYNYFFLEMTKPDEKETDI